MRVLRVQHFIFCLFVTMLMFSPVSANTMATVRYIEVLEAHPRMQKFDFSTKRFKDGPSAQISLSDLQQKEKELEMKLQQMTTETQTSLKRLGISLTKEDSKKSNAETDYWKEKERLDQQIESLKNEIAANIAAMEFRGQTIEVTILPELNQIISDVNIAIADAAKSNNCTIVLNETLPFQLTPETDDWIEEGYKIHFRDINSDKEILKRWIQSSEKITRKLYPQTNLLKPVLTNYKDITIDAIKLLAKPAKKGVRTKK